MRKCGDCEKRGEIIAFISKSFIFIVISIEHSVEGTMSGDLSFKLTTVMWKDHPKVKVWAENYKYIRGPHC